MRRLDRQLPTEDPIGALDDLASRPVTGGVHVVVEEAGPAPEEIPAVLLERRPVLGDAADGLDPQAHRLAGRRRAEALEQLC